MEHLSLPQHPFTFFCVRAGLLPVFCSILDFYNLGGGFGTFA